MHEDRGRTGGASLDHDLAPGARLARYLVLEELGRGGMGVIYAAYDPELDRKVAVKLLHSEQAVEQGQARLLREAQTLARLSHPNVIQVYDVGALGERVFIAMELLQGESLESWLQHSPRHWREVVDRFLAAGEGLAAAHEAGVVHRDFKPANVFLTRDGRVRVLDFGLARPPRAESPESAVQAAPDSATASPAVDSAAGVPDGLTRAGVVLGTPRYVAPELFSGRPADEQSDQFSFCVALYEALFGVPPFGSTSLRERESLAAPGPLAPPPSGVRVPAWLRSLVERGLRARPEERYPALGALLADLRRDRSAQRRRWALAGAAALLVAAAVWWALVARSLACSGAAERLAPVWNPRARAAVRQALVGGGRPFAAAAADATERHLDAYAASWSAMHRETCEATRLRREQSAALLDLRMDCLTQRLREFEGLVRIFASGDPELVEDAANASASLPPIAQCADTAALRAPLPVPATPEQRAEAERQREELARLEALWTAGRYAEALPEARRLVAAAGSLGHAPGLAQALHLQSRLEESSGDYAAAENTLHRALVAGAAGRHDRLLAQACIDLVGVVGFRGSRFTEGHRWGALGGAYLERLDRPELLRADLLSQEAMVFRQEGAADRGLRSAEEALGIYERLLPPDHPLVSRTLNRVGAALQGLDRDAEALAVFERALELSRRALGEDHPTVAVRLGNIAIVLEQLGRPEAALVAQREAIAIEERAFGPSHPQLALSWANLAGFLDTLGRPQEALESVRRALEMQRALLGPEHPETAATMTEEAEALAGLGRHDEALTVARAARNLLERALGPDHEWVASAVGIEGRELLALDRPAEALEPLRRRLALGGDLQDLGRSRFRLARALWMTGEQEEALAAALAAAADFAGAGDATAREAAEVAVWIERRQRTS